MFYFPSAPAFTRYDNPILKKCADGIFNVIMTHSAANANKIKPYCH